MEKVKQDWSRDCPRKRLRWDLVRAYSEAGRNRGILNTVKKECKRGRARATRQLSMPACIHCSQHCINVNPMARKVLWWESELSRWQLRKHNRETKPSGPMHVDDRNELQSRPSQSRISSVSHSAQIFESLICGSESNSSTLAQSQSRAKIPKLLSKLFHSTNNKTKCRTHIHITRSGSFISLNNCRVLGFWWS